VKEALACGLPVVSVDVGDVAERIEGVKVVMWRGLSQQNWPQSLVWFGSAAKRLDCRMQLEELSTWSVAQKLKRCYEDITREGRSIRLLASPDRLSIPAISSVNRAVASARPATNTTPEKY